MDINTLLDNAREWLAAVLAQPLIQAALVILIALAIARLLEATLIRVLRGITRRTRTTLDDQVLSLLHKPLFWSVTLIGVLLAVPLLGLADGLYSLLHSLLLSVIIVLWTRVLLRLSATVLRAVSRDDREGALVRTQTLPLFQNLALILTLLLALYFIFQAWSIDMTAWLASAGVAGIAIGFAAKDTLANLFSGVFILADSPYKIGDYVVLDNGQRGAVTHIGIRSTRLLTRDDVEVTIPNSIMGNTQIINESGGPHEKFRIRVKVGVAYGSDVDQVRTVLMEVAQGNAGVCAEPEPRVRLRGFGASSLDFELLAWVEKPELRGRTLDALNTQVYKAFQQQGIEIPYQKTDVYIKEAPQPMGK